MNNQREGKVKVGIERRAHDTMLENLRERERAFERESKMKFHYNAQMRKVLHIYLYT